MMKRFCACLLTALLMMSSAFAAVGVDAFVADKDENYIPIPAAYEVYTTFKNLDDYGFMNHPEDIFIGKDNLLYVADTENNRVLVMNREGVVLEEITEALQAARRVRRRRPVRLDCRHGQSALGDAER